MKDKKPIIKIKKKSFKTPIAIMACLMAMVMPNWNTLVQAASLAATPIPLPQDVALTAKIGEVERLPLYAEPDPGSRFLGEYLPGTPLVITQETSDQWLKVLIGQKENGREGYMRRDALILTFMQANNTTDRTRLLGNISRQKQWKLYMQPDKKSTVMTLSSDVPYYIMGLGLENADEPDKVYWHVLVDDPATGKEIAGYVPYGSVKETPFHLGAVNNANPEDRLHLREEPSAKAPSKGKYYNGTLVYVIGTDPKSTWVEVMIPVTGTGGFKGYMNSKFLATGPARNQVEEVFPVITVNNPGSAQNIKLRTTPSTSGQVIERYPNGTKIEVMGITQGWYHVTVEGKTGFMLAEFLDPQIPFDYSK